MSETNYYKLIFLDIDGVLNSSGTTDLIENTFSAAKLDFLKELVDSLGEKSVIVVISDRRLYEAERKNIDKVFKRYGFAYNYLSKERTHKSRSEEIIEYISQIKNLQYKFVILDDIDFEYTNNDTLERNYIKIGLSGLTKEDCINARNMLLK